MPENIPIKTVNGYIGRELQRPECAVAHESGLVIVPNWSGNGGISLISPDNQTHHILCSGTKTLRPNGIALEADGCVLLAHLGDSSGGIYRLYPDGRTTEVVVSVEGKPMPPANFIVKDISGRLWITVSTRKIPRASDYRAGADSGFIAVAEPGASDATIVADNLGYTNECVVDEKRSCVYVNETFGRRLTRFDLHDGAQQLLSNKKTIHSFGEGSYPDGLALDEQGGLWITSIVSNRILKIEPDGASQIYFEDSNDAHLLRTEEAYRCDALGREHLDTAQSRYMQNISNVAFGGVDRKRLYLGNLLGNTLPYLNVDVRGAMMVHWNTPLGPLEDYL